ncbi:MAG: hypothetical protein V4440_04710, partial [Pseudomonadota bacterium]
GTATTKTSVLINNPTPLPDATRGEWNIVTIAAAGTSQSDATAIGNAQPFVLISNNSASNGVLLPTASYIGQQIVVYPTLVSGATKIYPPVGGTINTGVLNTPVASTARKSATYISVDRTGLNYVTLGL